MKAAGAKVAEGGGLERELCELQDSLNQKVTPLMQFSDFESHLRQLISV